LIDAVTHLADATVRPVVRTLQAVGEGITPKEGTPRVELRQIEQSGIELVSSTVRLMERLAGLTLGAVGSRRGEAESAEPASAALARAPSAAPGAQLRLPMTVENPGSAPMLDLRFRLVELKGPEGSPLGAAAIHVEPQPLTVAPHDFEKLLLVVNAPADALPGLYEGRLELEGRPDFVVPFRFRIGS
jgi:hypothetical protein